MEQKEISGATVNDGKGLYDTAGLCETLITDLNRLPRLLVDNQFIAFCDTVAKMGQKMNCVLKGIKNDLSSRDEKITQLEEQLRAAGDEIDRLNGEHDGKEVDRGLRS